MIWRIEMRVGDIYIYVQIEDKKMLIKIIYIDRLKNQVCIFSLADVDIIYDFLMFCNSWAEICSVFFLIFFFNQAKFEPKDWINL